MRHLPTPPASARMPLPRPLRDRHAAVALAVAVVLVVAVVLGVERFVGWGTVAETARDIAPAA